MIKFVHSSWAYVVLFMLVFTLIKFLISLFTNKKFTYGQDFRFASFTLIAIYIQAVLGIIAYFFSTRFEGIMNGFMSEYMKNATDRLVVIEHPAMMFLALLISHYGFNRMKKTIHSKRQLVSIVLFYGITLLFVLIRIPWGAWLN
jgi:hypothetical protein